MCGKYNQFRESYDKRVGFSTNLYSRCSCDFVGISQSKKSNTHIAAGLLVAVKDGESKYLCSMTLAPPG